MPEEVNEIVTEEDVASYITELEHTGKQDINQAIYGEEVQNEMVRSSTKSTVGTEGTPRLS